MPWWPYTDEEFDVFCQWSEETFPEHDNDYCGDDDYYYDDLYDNGETSVLAKAMSHLKMKSKATHKAKTTHKSHHKSRH